MRQNKINFFNNLKVGKIALVLSIFVIAYFSFSFYSSDEALYRKATDRESLLRVKSLPLSYVAPGKLNHKNEQRNLSFDKAVRKFLKRWSIKGASVAVAKEGKLIYSAGYGYSNIEENDTVSSGSLFRIASVSKLITAVGVMHLIDNNKLDINASVFGKEGILSEYKEFRDKKVKNITVHHLLNHKAGWSWRDGDFMFQSGLIENIMELDGPPTQHDIIDFVLKKRRLRYKPGQYYAYSNFGYMLLGKIIEKVSGDSYEDYIQQNILLPNGIIGMRLTGNYKHDRRPFEVNYYDYPTAHEYASFDGLYESVPKPYGGSDIAALEGAGAWIANASQIVKLVNLLDYEYGRYTILSEDLLKKMTDVENYHDAIGWKGSRDGNWWRTGTLSGTSSFVYRRNDGLSFAIIANSSVWMGHRFNKRMKWMMEDAVKHFDEWEDQDLFLANDPNPWASPFN